MKHTHPSFQSFAYNPKVSAKSRIACIDAIESLPGELRRAVAGLNDKHLNASYREKGWTLRQVVHHLADSHLHAYSRMRFALTEETPTIKPYDQDRWSALDDARSLPLEPSLQLLEGLHVRWTALLRSLQTNNWARAVCHPEFPPDAQRLTLDWLLQHYAWHGRHHVEQITGYRKQHSL